MQELLKKIYSDGFIMDSTGFKHPIAITSIDSQEGQFLGSFIQDRPQVVRTLEVGCALGLASLHIAGATLGRPGAFHMIVDPFQSTQWKNVGIEVLKEAGIDTFTLLEEPSEFALPRLASDGDRYDLVFIDGWHTFDHTLVDLFYSNRLIRPGGYIVVDDCGWRTVAKAVDYFSQYPCFELVAGSNSTGRRRLANAFAAFGRPLLRHMLPGFARDNYFNRARFPTMVALQKNFEDDRNYDWFVSF